MWVVEVNVDRVGELDDVLHLGGRIHLGAKCTLSVYHVS